MLELDTSSLLDPKDARHYQSLTGTLRWIVELGRMGTCLEVSMMASYTDLTRDGKLEMMCRVFDCPKKHDNAEMTFDPSMPNINNDDFKKLEWSCYEFSVIIKIKGESHPREPAPRGM